MRNQIVSRQKYQLENRLIWSLFGDNWWCLWRTCCIYADVEWVKKDIEVEVNEEESDETMKAELEGKIDGDLMRIYHLLKTEMKFMKNDIGEVMKIATGKRGDELDKEKYKMLVSEYRKFKTKNVKHFKFSSAANSSTFGKDEFVQWSRTM